MEIVATYKGIDICKVIWGSWRTQLVHIMGIQFQLISITHTLFQIHHFLMWWVRIHIILGAASPGNYHKPTYILSSFWHTTYTILLLSSSTVWNTPMCGPALHYLGHSYTFHTHMYTYALICIHMYFICSHMDQQVHHPTSYVSIGPSYEYICITYASICIPSLPWPFICIHMWYICTHMNGMSIPMAQYRLICQSCRFAWVPLPRHYCFWP